MVCARHQLPLVLRFAATQFAGRAPARARDKRLASRWSGDARSRPHRRIGPGPVATRGVTWRVRLRLRRRASGAAPNYWMMLTNYLQHVGCAPGASHDHSRNFVSPFWNWFVFDNGITPCTTSSQVCIGAATALASAQGAEHGPGVEPGVHPDHFCRRYLLPQHRVRAVSFPVPLHRLKPDAGLTRYSRRQRSVVPAQQPAAPSMPEVHCAGAAQRGWGSKGLHGQQGSELGRRLQPELFDDLVATSAPSRRRPPSNPGSPRRCARRRSAGCLRVRLLAPRTTIARGDSGVATERVLVARPMHAPCRAGPVGLGHPGKICSRIR